MLCYVLASRQGGSFSDDYCTSILSAKVSCFLLLSFYKQFYKSLIPHLTLKLFIYCFWNLLTWATFLTKLQTRSCYTDRTMEQRLCGHREYRHAHSIYSTVMEVYGVQEHKPSQESKMFWLIACAAALFVCSVGYNDFVFSFIFA